MRRPAPAEVGRCLRLGNLAGRNRLMSGERLTPKVVHSGADRDEQSLCLRSVA